MSSVQCEACLARLAARFRWILTSFHESPAAYPVVRVEGRNQRRTALGMTAWSVELTPYRNFQNECQRRSKTASACRSKNTSVMLARRVPELGAFSSDIMLGSDYPPACPSWHGVSCACSD